MRDSLPEITSSNNTGKTLPWRYHLSLYFREGSKIGSHYIAAPRLRFLADVRQSEQKEGLVMRHKY